MKWCHTSNGVDVCGWLIWGWTNISPPGVYHVKNNHQYTRQTYALDLVCVVSSFIISVCFIFLKSLLYDKARMQKSTPIAKLSQNQQQASPSIPNIPSITPPQPIPTQPATDPSLMGEDESTIQEVLNQIHQQSATSTAPQIQLSQLNQMPMTPPQTQAYPQEGFGVPSAYPAAYPGMSMPMLPQQPMAPSVSSTGNNTVDMMISMFADDIKLAVLVFVMVVAVHFIPASAILGKYIAIDKIPYHDVIIRGLLCAILVVFTRKLVKI